MSALSSAHKVGSGVLTAPSSPTRQRRMEDQPPYQTNMQPSLAAVFAQHWPAYHAAYGTRMPPQHRRAARAIMQCRTADLGSVLYRCGDCGRMEARPISCGHRACNACGQHKSMEWEARQKARLLPVPYHMAS